ncbi:MAG: DegV family protein [Chloroflexia bacterium]|nr:DegV family protein [Chloroflexia bacterium]
MSRVAIVTDSTADLTAEQLAAYDITMVPLNVHFGDETLQDQVEITTDQFMERLASSAALPTTSQPSAGQFEEAFRGLAQNHDAVVAVLLSSKLSGTVQSAQLAANTVADTIQVEVVDSLNASLCLGFQAIRAATLRDEGLDAPTISARLRDEVDAYHLLFFVETLEHLRRGGRIGKAATMVGSLLRLRPLLRVDEGQIVPFERTRTRGRALNALVEFAKGLSGVDVAAALYNTTPHDAADLAGQLQALTPEHEVLVAQFSTVLGAHVGPGAVGLAVRERSRG